MAVWTSFLGHHLLALLFLVTMQQSFVLGQMGENSESASCDLFHGSWVYDDSYPVYDGSNCPFIAPALNCQKNGRPDNLYLKYTWKPDGCELPRFNGEDFLQRNRGKKIMFVGDSLSSNQWQSLACMLHTAVPNSNYTFAQTVARSSLSFPEYGVSLIFLKNGFLVDLIVENMGRILKLDSISRSSQWEGADVLVFNSYHWWMHSGRLQTWDYYQVGDKITKDMDRMEAYQIALTTWANWVNSNIDPNKTTVFFQGISAVHYLGTDWNEPEDMNCIGQTQPVEGSNYPGNRSIGESIVKSVLANMTMPVYLLDITLLTQLRKDGHPSKYANGHGADCSHWCLPGVPDTWNQLLNTFLLLKEVLWPLMSQHYDKANRASNVSSKFKKFSSFRAETGKHVLNDQNILSDYASHGKVNFEFKNINLLFDVQSEVKVLGSNCNDTILVSPNNQLIQVKLRLDM